MEQTYQKGKKLDHVYFGEKIYNYQKHLGIMYVGNANRTLVNIRIFIHTFS